MTGSDETSSTSGFTCAEQVDQEGRRVEPQLHADLRATSGPWRGVAGGRCDQLAQASDDVVDLAADRTEDANLAVRESWRALRLLAGETISSGRADGREQRPRLGPIGPEEVAVVVVVHHHDRDQPLLAHPGLDARDAVEADVHPQLLPGRPGAQH